MSKFSLFTKALILFWSFFMFADISFLIYASFHFGTARWMWRPVEVSGNSKYVKNGIYYQDSYKVIIR